jgi:hypothetical protein
MSITFGSENTDGIDPRPASPSGAFLERGCAGSARLSSLTKGKRAPEKIELFGERACSITLRLNEDLVGDPGRIASHSTGQAIQAYFSE